ncbi:HAD family hydrolase [Microbacterium sp.]|uniref:HAD family hydrolase n=1 Tax=Microbacterium sp. TaxID=51671 RepID=UPI000926C576|nr:HAD family hydrolase [Microbacterium sp.]MBN9187126.1 HAD family hydrolase [Microbacterium sp.]MBN9192999.1 HAD family hydrolase [Microbacterium sp.]OJU61342.1 MAG: HAD family hydrolase [Microbacterium sp. 70-38]
MASPRITTVLFDIDGTLVDSNYLHVDAWDRALVAVDHPVDVWRIHRGIGMDASRMLSELVGDDDALQERAKDEHARLYADMADRLRPISGARDLLRELSRRGLTVVLATSAPQEELDALLAVLDLDEPVDAVTSAEDVDDAKPAPDVVGRALEKAGAAASEAIMVGDAVWDIESAGRAGVTAVAVLTGGSSADQLRDAGAVAVYDDVASLLAQLDASPLVANAD